MDILSSLFNAPQILINIIKTNIIISGGWAFLHGFYNSYIYGSVSLYCHISGDVCSVVHTTLCTKT